MQTGLESDAANLRGSSSRHGAELHPPWQKRQSPVCPIEADGLTGDSEWACAAKKQPSGHARGSLIQITATQMAINAAAARTI